MIRVLLEAHNALVGARDAHAFAYLPSPRDRNEAADLQARSEWYLAPIGLPVSRLDTKRKVRDAREQHLHLLLRSHGLREIAGALRHRGPLSYVDPDGYNASDAYGYERLLNEYLDLGATAGLPFTALARALGGSRSAFILCTGPSATSVDLRTIDADVRIICNSAVRDERILEDLAPNIITFADPVFHFGPSRYARIFRADMMRAVEQTDAWILLPDPRGRLLLHHYPEFKSRTILLRHTAQDWSWPGQSDSDETRVTANILTLSMLPVAFALADNILVAGCDGRSPNEQYFWHHSSRLQYSDELMKSAWDAHPSFFRDRIYPKYYRTHCRETEALIAAGEAAGKTIQSLTPSYVPALGKRNISDVGAL